MPEAPSSIQLLEPLPPLVQYSLRYRATQTAWPREVECRLAPTKGPPAVQALFAQEQKELGHLDHPSFLPLLGTGVAQGRPYYLVPARQDPSLEEVMAEGTLSLEERGRIVRSLAGAMAALHLRSCTVRHLSPRTMALCRRRNQVYFMHHRTPPPPGLDGLEARMPEDVRRAKAPSPAADLFHWGWLAYRLLSGGEEPYPGEDGRLVPLGPQVPGLAPELAEVVECCLAWSPTARPSHAGELAAVLASERAVLASPEPRRFDYQATVAELRIGGHIPEPGSLREEPAEAGPGEAAGPGSTALLLLGFLMVFLASFFLLGRS